VIKIAHNISNLSDARYFAAYGFDWIIFNFGPGAQQHRHLLYGISEWISGARIGMHVDSYEDLYDHMEHHPEVSGFLLGDGVIVEDTYEQYTFFGFSPLNQPLNYFLIVNNVEDLFTGARQPVLDLTFNDPRSVDLHVLKPAGITISGTEEERPGFKSYASMEEWMDILDTI